MILSHKAVKPRPQGNYTKVSEQTTVEQSIQSRIQDILSDMRYYISIITVMFAICSCRQESHRFHLSVLYTPGIVEYSVGGQYVMDQFINEMKSIRLPDRICKLTHKDYLFLYDILSSPKTETAEMAVPAPIIIRFCSTLYIVGDNRVVDVNGKTYEISEENEYKIKCVVRFYDSFYGEYLTDNPEICKYGVPDNQMYYYYSDANGHRKRFAKVILQE